MINNAWTLEFSRILVVVIAALLFGLVSGAWLWAILLPASIYIGWTLFQIRAFEQWIRTGAKTATAPDSNGIWQLIVQHIHRTQKKNKTHKQRLGQLARRYEATIAALPDATVVLNANLDIEWANQNALDILGVDRKRDQGLRLDNLIRDPALQTLLDAGDAVTQLEMISPVDPLKTLSLNSVRFGESQTLITARDISQRLAVQKLRKAFIANASHELRTPLTVIAGYLEMLEEEMLEKSTQTPPAMQKAITSANQQATRMQSILDDLLTLSKLEERGLRENSGEPINMARLITGLIDDFKKIKAEDSHQFELSVDSRLMLFACEGEIFSMCQNIISNAMKYSPRGSKIKICWRADEQGRLCFSVLDNGEGIAPEHLSRLTERFYRVNVNRSRRVGGTGLGLSIVKHIVENHGGQLDISSELGKGSTFSACFPSRRAVK